MSPVSTSRTRIKAPTASPKSSKAKGKAASLPKMVKKSSATGKSAASQPPAAKAKNTTSAPSKDRAKKVPAPRPEAQKKSLTSSSRPVPKSVSKIVKSKATSRPKPALPKTSSNQPTATAVMSPEAVRERVMHEQAQARAKEQAYQSSRGLVDDDLGPLPSDEVFDEADGAQHNQLRELADVQRRALLANRPEQHPDFDGIHCIECDDEIPAPRLILLKIRCVHCQRDFEERQRRQR